MESAGSSQDPSASSHRQSGFFGWVSRKPKVAFWTTLGIALLIGLGIGAASVEEETGRDADLEAQLEDAEAGLEDAEDKRDDVEDELEEVTDELASAKRRARSAERKLRQARLSTPAPKAPTDSAVNSPSSDVQSFSGNGGKNLGTITVEEESVLEWTNDGDIFQIFTADAVPVNSQGNSGETVLAAGSHADFQVNAVGNWTITIRPR